MFPMTLTIHTPVQLNAVLAALKFEDVEHVTGTVLGATEVHERRNETQAKKDAAAQVEKPTGAEKAAPARSPRTAAAGPSTSGPTADAPAKDTAAPAAENTTAKDADASSAKPVTYETVAKAITEGVKINRPHVVTTLKEFGAGKGPDLKPEQYADFLTALHAAPEA